jgi:hypothetical protein
MNHAVLGERDLHTWPALIQKSSEAQVLVVVLVRATNNTNELIANAGQRESLAISRQKIDSSFMKFLT